MIAHCANRSAPARRFRVPGEWRVGTCPLRRCEAKSALRTQVWRRGTKRNVYVRASFNIQVSLRLAHGHEAQEFLGDEPRSELSAQPGLVTCGFLAACCRHGR